MDYYCKRRPKFQFLREEFQPSKSPQFNIKFHFFLKSQHKQYILNKNPTSQPFVTTGHASAAVAAAGESPPLGHVAEAVAKTTGCLLYDGERDDLTELVCKHVSRSFSTAETLGKHRHGVLHLFFDVRVDHRHVYVSVEDDSDGGGGDNHDTKE